MTRSGLNLDNFDRSVRPQDDLFGFVNGGWRARTEVPSDRARYGTFDRLREESEAAMRDIITEAAESDSEPGTPRRKVGDLYASFLDEARAEELGVQPLADDLAAIDTVSSTADVLRLVGRLQRTGVSGFVGFYSIADAKDPQRNVLYVMQDGIGLPDESYYREDEHADTREKYVTHMGRLLGLAGLDAASPTR